MCTPVVNKLTTFIHDCSCLHNNKYDYNLVEYKNVHTKVCIVCPVHGEFWQTPNNHKNHKQGCPSCAGNRRSNVAYFSVAAAVVHNNKYDYNLVEYKNNHTKVCIVCPVHGEFWQTPNNHIHSEQGCPSCAGNQPLTKSSFIERAVDVHGIAYDYALVEYSDVNTKVAIICKKHGVFYQRPSKHIYEQNGCPSCAGKGDVHERQVRFFEQSLDTHNNLYDYSRVEYVDARTPVTIVCPTHGPFSQIPNNHTSHKSGCPVCASYGASNIAVEWLEGVMKVNNIHIQHARNGGEFNIPGTRLRVDGYCRETNTIYEFHGDVWHGNPTLFNPQQACHPFVDITAGSLYNMTIKREQKIKDMGYDLIVVWEYDYITQARSQKRKHHDNKKET